MRFSIILLAGLVAVAAAPRAEAADWYTGSTALEPPTESWIVDVDSSVTVARNSLFAGVSATFAAVDNLKTSGWRGRVEGLAGRYTYEQATTKATIRSQQEGGALMAGYEWVSRTSTVSLWAGMDIKHTSLSDPDPENSVVGTGVGVKFAGHFYTMLTDDMMATGYGSYSTLHNAYYGRIKVGWSIGRQVYVGPEVSALGDDFYKQYRVGAHLSGLRIGALALGISGGFLHDDRQGSGAYGIIDARMGF